MSQPGDRFPLDTMFQDAGGTKELCGQSGWKDDPRYLP